MHRMKILVATNNKLILLYKKSKHRYISSIAISMHPYRQQMGALSSERVSLQGNLSSSSLKGSTISPHTSSSSPTSANNKKHPYLNQLPDEVSSSMEKLYIKGKSKGGSERNNVEVKPKNAINNSTISRPQMPTSSANNSYLTDTSVVSERDIIDKYSKMHTLGSTDVSLILPEVSEEEIFDESNEQTTKLAGKPNESLGKEISDLFPDFKESTRESKEVNISQGTNNLSDPLLKDIIACNIPKTLNLAKEPEIPRTPNGAYNELFIESEESLVSLNTPSPIVTVLKPPGNNTKNESENSNLNSSSTVNLLPMGVSIEMYGENAKKTKDPDVLFSYAQVLIKSAISKNTDDSITEKKRAKYLSEAYAALKKASRSGNIESQYYLGDAYSCGLFNKGKPDNYKALQCFEAAGKAKHAESAYRTSICYRKGLGCNRDARKVVKFLEIAAMNNHPVAQMEYGIYCFHGLMGLPEDSNTKKKGISWLRRATECATLLSCGAPYELALIYLNGFRDIVIQDISYGIKLLFKAANLGHGKSASVLGKIYEIGDIVDPNPDLSIHFYDIGATLGDPDSMMGLCSWYFVGSKNLAKDYNKAFSWALKAAELDSIKAMHLLQRFYEMGLGCEKDLEMAKHWSLEASKLEKLHAKKSKE